MAANLSNVKCKQLKADPSRVLMIGDGDRLYLRIYPSGRKSWMLRSSKSLKTLGEYDDNGNGMSLADARRIAHSGRKATAVLFNKSTVADVAAKFYDTQIVPRNRHPDQIRRYLERDLTTIAGKKIVDVTRPDLAELLGDKAKTSPIAANILLAVIKRLFRYARAYGIIDTDPAALLDRTLAGGMAETRDRVLSDDEIKRLWEATGKGTPGYMQHGNGALLRFLLLCGQRIAETQATEWRDIDFKTRRWHIPKERTKTQKQHWVALPDMAIELLEALPRDGDKVFPQRSPSSVQSWLRRWCKQQGITQKITPHDLRRTMATRMNDLSIGPHIVERILNHKMEGVMAIYNRATYETERVEAQTTWAIALTALVYPDRTSSTRKQRRNLNLVSSTH